LVKAEAEEGEDEEHCKDPAAFPESLKTHGELYSILSEWGQAVWEVGGRACEFGLKASC
jgi:hypothetical protein